MLTKNEQSLLLEKLLSVCYLEMKVKFEDTFKDYSVTYESSGRADIYLLNCNNSFNEVLKIINLTKEEYDYLYQAEYETCEISYTNINHTLDHLWKPIENILKTIETIQKKID